jgi:hypothetical protein
VFSDISAGTNGYVYSLLGNGGMLSGISAVSAGLTVGLYGIMDGVTVDKGQVLVSRYGTATNVHVGSGVIEVVEADTTDVKILASGTLVYNNCSVTGTLTGAGSLCRINFTSNCTLSSVTLESWGVAYLINANGEDITLDSGECNGSSCSMLSVNVLSGATARFFSGSHGMIVVSSGGIYEVTSSADASNVHVLSGGSLNCIREAHVWACTSDAGAIVTGSNIEIL